MSDEATFHEGYRKALEDVTAMVDNLTDECRSQLGDFLTELTRRTERARVLSRSSLAAGAAGPEGY